MCTDGIKINIIQFANTKIYVVQSRSQTQSFRHGLSFSSTNLRKSHAQSLSTQYIKHQKSCPIKLQLTVVVFRLNCVFAVTDRARVCHKERKWMSEQILPILAGATNGLAFLFCRQYSTWSVRRWPTSTRTTRPTVGRRRFSTRWTRITTECWPKKSSSRAAWPTSSSTRCWLPIRAALHLDRQPTSCYSSGSASTVGAYHTSFRPRHTSCLC